MGRRSARSLAIPWQQTVRWPIAGAEYKADFIPPWRAAEGFAIPSLASRPAGDVGRPDPDDNPAPGSRIRSIRALDLGLAPMSGVWRALVEAIDWLAAGARQAVGPYSHLRSDRGSWVGRPLSKGT